MRVPKWPNPKVRCRVNQLSSERRADIPFMTRFWIKPSNRISQRVASKMSLDSTVFFDLQLKEHGLSDFKSKFVENGWTTLNNFAMAGNYIPGSSDESSLVHDVIIPITGDSSDIRKIGVKRLFWQAFLGHATEVKRRAAQDDNNEEGKTRRMPTVEKASRYDALKVKYNGLDLETEEQAEPSYKLVDTIVDMIDKSELRHIRWEECTRRDQEFRGVKKIPGFLEDPNGTLKRTYTDVVQPDADYSDSEQLRFVFMRRGLAFEVARLMTYNVHYKIVQHLLKCMNATPLHGYSNVTLEQAHRADIEIFRQLGKLARYSLAPEPDGTPVLDKFVEGVLKEESVKWLLMPPKSGEGKSHGPTPKTPKGDSAGANEIARLKAQVEALRKNAKDKKANGWGNGKGKGAGGGKGKGNGRAVPSDRDRTGPKLPRPLIGLDPKIDDENACFDYNMDKCTREVTNSRCSKGVHKCMVNGCKSKNHGATKHSQ